MHTVSCHGVHGIEFPFVTSTRREVRATDHRPNQRWSTRSTARAPSPPVCTPPMVWNCIATPAALVSGGRLTLSPLDECEPVLEACLAGVQQGIAEARSRGQLTEEEVQALAHGPSPLTEGGRERERTDGRET